MFGLVRVFIGIASFFILILLLSNKYKEKERLKVVVSAIISLIVTLVFVMIPFENTLYSFPSPRKAFEYCHFGKIDNILVVEGEDSAFVIGVEERTYSHLIIPKIKDGWGVGRGYDTRTTRQKMEGDFLVCIYHYTETNECYVSVSNLKGGDINVSDTLQSLFIPITVNSNNLDEYTYTYYAYVGFLDSSYKIIADDTIIEDLI